MRLRATCCGSRVVFIAANPPAARISGYSRRKPRIERISMSWNTLISRAASRPAIVMISISESQPAIHSAARVLDCVRSIAGKPKGLGQAGIGEGATICNAHLRRGSDAAVQFHCGSEASFDAKGSSFRTSRSGDPESRDSTVCNCTPEVWSSGPSRNDIRIEEDLRMRILQPAEWSKPRGFSHGVEVDGAGKWIVLAGQTGGDEKGDYAPDMAAQVGTALKRIIKLLGEAGAGPEHIVRLTWYLTSRSEYEAAGPGIGAAWKETLGRNFPPSTLLYIDGLVDIRAKVEIEVTAFVPQA